ncbi:T9SS type A sorting domain-containing protein [Psychroserpens jangbogonensis]|uniref:T9SS type A sorting domain-containing protein n=1 Tax=Psychroserpens jangbogonensis TaxID=1484460 RepID=UPI00053DA0E6|nr:T9SS type A sorting domain-containing protein [Psychroserpens jangbogonensis]
MKKKLFLGALILILLVVLVPFTNQQELVSKVERKVFTPTQKGEKKTMDERAEFSEARLMHEYYRQVNPITGEVSKSDKNQEFEQARNAQLNSGALAGRNLESNYINRGPTNFGGRTRSLVIDKSDTSGNTMIAAAVTGGVFRTTNGGDSWDKVSSYDEIHNATCLVQDPRTGFENTWYYGTGEFWFGNVSAGGFAGSPYLGQGVWKSTDGGVTWIQMPSTGSTQEAFDSPFDYVTRLAVHPITGDLYAAANGEIARFNGTVWNTEIANPTNLTNFNGVTDVVITSGGRVYAALSGDSDASVEGVWTSDDGIGNWTRINNGFFTPSRRVVLALAPSNQNKLYTLFVNENTGGCTGLNDPVQEADLWLWDQSSQIYINYSNILPFEGDCSNPEPLNVQIGWDLCVSVKPNDENFVAIGGTSAYVKEDITDNSTRFKKIGGYLSSPGAPNSSYSSITIDPHHPDIQYLVFSPQNNNALFSATDGGIHKTDDVTATTIGWQNLNNNYQTYQFWHVAIDPLNGSDIVLGGTQDNGTKVGGTDFGLPDLTTQQGVLGGDGVAVDISRDEGNCFGFMGSQNGFLLRADCVVGSADITPQGSNSQFVTYFYLDSDNNNALYYAGQNTLYKTSNASNVTSSTWENAGNTNDDLGVNDWFQTFSTSKGVYNPSTSYLLMGGDEGRIYKLNDPWNVTNISQSIDITPSGATIGFPSFVTGLAVHPTNNDIVLATYANYGTNSIFITADATSNNPTWTLVERNLSAHSIRSAAITEEDGETLYFVGTARGLYSTGNPTNEDWIREAPGQIGFALVSSLAYRHSDNHLLIGTFGNGMYEAVLSPSLGVNDFDDISNSISIYPNPVASSLNIKIKDNNTNLSYKIINLLGQQIVSATLDKTTIDVSNLKAGIYIIELTGDNKKGMKRFIKK